MIKLVEARRKAGLSQSKLARLADVNQTSMSRIERGLEPAYPMRAQRIANALGWHGDPMELFEEADDGDD